MCSRSRISSSTFSDHSRMKIEINYEKRTGKFTNMCGLNNMLLNNQWVKEEIKKHLETNENGSTTDQTYGRGKGRCERDVHGSARGDAREIPHPATAQGPRRGRPHGARVSGRKEGTEIRAEIEIQWERSGRLRGGFVFCKDE